MAQHRCITQLAKNVYRARPTAGILTIDSRLNNYSFRLKNTHSARCATSFIYPFPAYAAEPFGGPWSSDSALLHSRFSYSVTTYSVTTYLLLHSCPMDNNKEANSDPLRLDYTSSLSLCVSSSWEGIVFFLRRNKAYIHLWVFAFVWHTLHMSFLFPFSMILIVRTDFCLRQLVRTDFCLRNCLKQKYVWNITVYVKGLWLCS